MSEIYEAMCLTATEGNGNIILEYVTPVPKNPIKDWDGFIRRQRVAGKPKVMTIFQNDQYYNDILKFKHGDKFWVKNDKVFLHPIREIEIPTGEYDITIFHKTR